jgi:hypothetical protein
MSDSQTVSRLSLHRFNEEVAVAIQPNDGIRLSVEEPWKHLDGMFAAFKVPNHVVILNDSLPRTTACKFLMREPHDLVDKGNSETPQKTDLGLDQKGVK